jgi:hypothetical protein
MQARLWIRRRPATTRRLLPRCRGGSRATPILFTDQFSPSDGALAVTEGTRRAHAGSYHRLTAPTSGGNSQSLAAGFREPREVRWQNQLSRPRGDQMLPMWDSNLCIGSSHARVTVRADRARNSAAIVSPGPRASIPCCCGKPGGREAPTGRMLIQDRSVLSYSRVAEGRRSATTIPGEYRPTPRVRASNGGVVPRCYPPCVWAQRHAHERIHCPISRARVS